MRYWKWKRNKRITEINGQLLYLPMQEYKSIINQRVTENVVEMRYEKSVNNGREAVHNC